MSIEENACENRGVEKMWACCAWQTNFAHSILQSQWQFVVTDNEVIFFKWLILVSELLQKLSSEI